MLRFTSKPRNDKETKSLLVYNILRQKKEVSRSDISDITRINVVSISNYINAFIKKGLIIEKEMGPSSGGRPPVILDLNKDGVLAIGLYVNESSISGIAVNSAIETVSKQKKDLSAGRPEEGILDMLGFLLKGKKTGVLRGIALINDGVNLDIPDLEKKIKELFNTDLYIEKAAVAAAYGESISALHKIDKLLYSHKDIGECVLLENYSFYTADDKTNENFAYLKAWNAKMSIANYARQIVEKGIGTEIISLAKGSVDNIADKEVMEAAKKNDNVAIEILEFVGLNLGVRLAYLTNVFKPNKLVLGGGIEAAGTFFLEPLKKSIEKLAGDEVFAGLEVANSVLGDEAVRIGSAALVIREIYMGV